MREFLISDLHLDHENIIKYCNRPFKCVNEMNAEIVSRWNSVVSKNDIVYFLGDFCNPRSNPWRWIKQMNGTIIFIKGNHDGEFEKHRIRNYDSLYFTRLGMALELVHDPENSRKRNGDWTIHGHVHNNYPDVFPLVNPTKRTINVSAELVNYTPIRLNSLFFSFQHPNIPNTIRSDKRTGSMKPK